MTAARTRAGAGAHLSEDPPAANLHLPAELSIEVGAWPESDKLYWLFLTFRRIFRAESSNNNNNQRRKEAGGGAEVPSTTLSLARPVSVTVDVVNHDEPSVCSNISNGGLNTVTTGRVFVNKMIEIFSRKNWRVSSRGAAGRTRAYPATI